MDEIIQENLNEETGISLKGFMRLLWRNVILIAVITILATACGVGYAMSIKPTYTATRALIVKASNANTMTGEGSDYNDITVATKELPTVAAFFKMSLVISEAVDIYENDGNGGMIASGAITVNYDTNTRFLTVSYTDSEPEFAKEKINAIIKAGKNVIEERNVDGTSKYFNVSIELMSADGNQAKIVRNLSRTTYVVLAFMLGLVLSIAIVLIKYFMDDTIKTKEELESITGVKMLAYLEKINSLEVGGKKDEKR